jgi:hypothetical protein
MTSTDGWTNRIGESMKEFLVAVFANVIANIVTAALGYLGLAFLGIFPVYPELVLGIVFGLAATVVGLSIAIILLYYDNPHVAVHVAWISSGVILAGLTISHYLTGYPRNSWQSLLAIIIPAVIVYGGLVIYRVVHGPVTARPRVEAKQG